MSTRAPKRDGWQGKLARKLWVVVQASETEVCAQVGITPKTLRRWRDWHDWDAERQAQGASLESLMARLRTRLGGLAEDFDAIVPGDSEALMANLKTANQLLCTVERITRIERDIDYKRLALRWARELADYLTERDPQALEQLAAHLKTFSMDIVRG